MCDNLEMIRHTIKDDGFPGADPEKCFTVPLGQLRSGMCNFVKPTLSIASNDEYRSTGKLKTRYKFTISFRLVRPDCNAALVRHIPQSGTNAPEARG